MKIACSIFYEKSTIFCGPAEPEETKMFDVRFIVTDGDPPVVLRSRAPRVLSS